MGMFSKVVLASVISFAASNSFADTLISCVGGKNNSTKLSYRIKATSSKRLGSDLEFEKNSVSQTISFLSVAQYASTSVLLYLVTDDFAENMKLRFTAAPLSKTTWIGAIEEIGASTTTTAVKCTSSNI